MKNNYKVTFKDVFIAESEEECYDLLLDYLAEIVRYEDLTAFGIKKIDEAKPESEGE